MHRRILSFIVALLMMLSLAVSVLAESGTETTFPLEDIGDLGVNRYHAAWVLWDQEGRQSPEGKTGYFYDVPDDSPYYDAVYWVVEQKIFGGMSENHFAGEDLLTRVIAAAILYNYANYLGMDTTATTDELPFEDATPDMWYYPRVLWCYENGLISGIDGKLLPNEPNLCSHRHTESVNREASCTEDGCLDGTVCTLCGALVTWKERYPATGHNHELVELVPSDCETDGYTLYRCSNCGEETQEILPAPGHDWDNGYVETFPNIYHHGRRVHTCRVCAAEGYSEIDHLNNLAFLKFGDISSGDYYYEPVLWAVQFGIAMGVDETRFAPYDTCTRGQVVTFLWRAAGCPDVPTQSPFVDVTRDAYYYHAVLWAAANGITTGTDSTHFSPDSTVTRAQFVTFLWRYFGCPETQNATPFTDVDPDEYYTMAVSWAAANGITTGTTETTFQPGNPCTRGQVVTFLYRA